MTICHGTGEIPRVAGGVSDEKAAIPDPRADQADLAGLQNALLTTDSLEQFLHELVTLSAAMVADGLSCGLSLRQRGRPPVTACSDPLASVADVRVGVRRGPPSCTTVENRLDAWSAST